MATPYVGEIRMFGGNFAPSGWMFCDGSLLPISEYEILFQLVGTTYGGDGQETFALPDLRGRLPVHVGGGRILSETFGAEEVTLTAQHIPAHSHAPVASAEVADEHLPTEATFGQAAADVFVSGTANLAFAPAALGVQGGSQPHTNLMPFLCVSFIICMFGIFPTPT